MKTIIVPTDFSPAAFNAANYASELAMSINASLCLLHVCPLPLIFGEISVMPLSLTEMEENANRKLKQLKNEMTTATDNKLKIYTEVRIGSVVTELKIFCASVKPFAVVMASRGAGAVERFFFGSNTLNAMKSLNWPLIVVPADARFRHIRKIGLACDYNQTRDTIPTKEIKDLVKQFKAELFIVYVNISQAEKFNDRMIEESGYLQEMLDELHPKYDFIGHTDLEEGLIKSIDRNQLDLLIVSPRKHGLADRIFHPDHAKRLVLHAHLPVMAIHA